MKSLSGSIETRAYVFRISHLSVSTSMGTALTGGFTCSTSFGSDWLGRCDFLDDLEHAVGSRRRDVGSHSLEASALLLLQSRVRARLCQIQVVEAEGDDLVGIVDVAQDVRLPGAFGPLLGLPGPPPVLVASRLQPPDGKKRVHVTAPLSSMQLSSSAFQLCLARQHGTHDEDRGRQVDQAQVADCVKPVGVVSGQGNGQPEHGSRNRRSPRPHVSAPDAEPRKCGDGETRGGDEPGDRDVEVTDVVVERGAEGLDLGLAHAHLALADAELEKAVGQVADEEDRGVADERGRAERHQPDARPERRRLFAVAACRDGSHVTPLLPSERVCPGKTSGEICYCILRNVQYGGGCERLYREPMPWQTIQRDSQESGSEFSPRSSFRACTRSPGDSSETRPRMRFRMPSSRPIEDSTAWSTARPVRRGSRASSSTCVATAGVLGHGRPSRSASRRWESSLSTGRSPTRIRSRTPTRSISTSSSSSAQRT